MRIWAYAICYNEELRLPYYLRHYEKFCEKIIIYDNESTDRSREIIRSHPLCELREYSTSNEMRDDVILNIKNNCWKEIKDTGTSVDYVVVGDIDEFIYHKNLKCFLEETKDYSVFNPAGFEMVSEKLLESLDGKNSQLYDVCTRGCFSTHESKKILFSPHKVREINWRPGCHVASVELEHGKEWNYSNYFYDPYKSPLKLLHFKYIDKNFILKRHNEFSRRLSSINKKYGWSNHYLKPNDEISKKFIALYNNGQDLDL